MTEPKPGRIIIGDASASSAGIKVNFLQPQEKESSDGARPNDFVGIGPNKEQFALDEFPMPVTITDDGAEYADYGRSWNEIHFKGDPDGDVVLGDGKSPGDTFPTLDINGRRDIPTGYRLLSLPSKLSSTPGHLVQFTPPAKLVPGVITFAGGGNTVTMDGDEDTPQIVEIGYAYVNEPQDTDRIYEAFASLTCVGQIDGLGYPPLRYVVGPESFVNECKLSAWLCISYANFNADDPDVVQDIVTQSSLLWSIEVAKTLTVGTLASFDVIGEAVIGTVEVTSPPPPATYDVVPPALASPTGKIGTVAIDFAAGITTPTVVGSMAGSAAVTTIFNYSITGNSGAPPAPEFGVFADTFASKVRCWIEVYSNIATDVDIWAKNGPDFPSRTGNILCDPKLYLKQYSYAESLAEPSPTPPPAPPSPPMPPPPVASATIYLTASTGEESWPFDQAVAVTVTGTDFENTYNVGTQPFTTTLELAPGDYTITAETFFDEDAVTVSTPTSGEFTVDDDGTISVGGADDTVTIVLDAP